MSASGLQLTPERFARGMTFDEYVAFTGSPENLAREGFDVRRFSAVRPRLDWSGFLRERYARARLTDDEVAGIRWLAAQPGGPAKILVLSEDWSSDCRRDVPYLARLGEAGGLELRIFTRDGETMLRQGLPDPASGGNADLVCAYANEKNGQRFASIPVAVFLTRDLVELHRCVEYPAIYRKDLVLGRLRGARPGETDAEARARAGRDIGALLESPFFDVWARAGIAEILSALHERRLTSAAG
jgi:thioredoxin family protein